MIEPEEQIKRFKEFIETHYKEKLIQQIRKDSKRLTIDFNELLRFDSELADDILDAPEETIKAAEIAIECFDTLGHVKKFRLRIKGNLPNSSHIRLRDLRAKHLDKFVAVEGSIESKTDVGVQITSIKYECPACGNIINVLQFTENIKEPTKCGCGRKGKFHVLDKEKRDGFTLRLQELSSSIVYGSDMKIKSVLCTNDLTQTRIEEKLVEGMKIKIHGIYKEKEVIKQNQKKTELMTSFSL
jgi:replicative DNA helicase Mcm